jgi:magnesium-transporting ATPase (P-type)
MNSLQFVLIASLLSLFPYIPPAIAGWKAVKLRTASSGTEEFRWLAYWIAELIVGLSVLAATVYLVEIGTFNGLIDINMFEKNDAQNLELVWNLARCVSQLLGLLLGTLLIHSGLQWHASRKDLATFLPSFGAFCVLYGLAVPQLMTCFIGAIRDSHLLN